MKGFALFLLLIIVVKLNSQERLYYKNKGERIEFILSQQEVYVELDMKSIGNIKKNGKGNILKLSSNSTLMSLSRFDNFIKAKRELINDYSEDFKKVEPVLLYADGTKQMYT
ncbi:MAG: hypothetical protein JEZ14_09535 [Marinilabiliaceae bacterium]|nr:hypothetical protein [Marinilabiliaceae bacterium]